MVWFLNLQSELWPCFLVNLLLRCGGGRSLDDLFFGLAFSLGRIPHPFPEAMADPVANETVTPECDVRVVWRKKKNNEILDAEKGRARDQKSTSLESRSPYRRGHPSIRTLFRPTPVNLSGPF